MKKNKESQFPCRSEWGYYFVNNIPKLSKQTLLAKKTIGLDFGAADVLKYKNEYYFLELNSAPSIDHWRLEEFYKKEINKL